MKNNELLNLANLLEQDAAEFEDTDPALARELREIVEMGRQYAVRSAEHEAIIAEAKVRKQNGEDLDMVYRDATVRLLATWPDAEAYGNALVMLKHALMGDH